MTARTNQINQLRSAVVSLVPAAFRLTALPLCLSASLLNSTHQKTLFVSTFYHKEYIPSIFKNNSYLSDG